MAYFNHTFWKMLFLFILILIIGILGIVSVGVVRGDIVANLPLDSIIEIG